jgi:hypothetical protein
MVREQGRSLYQLGVWAWWEDLYYQRAREGHQPGYRDFCTGNVSLRRADFLAVGGFDTRFRGYGGEDYDLGYRLLKAGVRFIPHPGAQAKHYHRTTVEGVLRATRQEAHGDVVLGRKYPELRAGLRLIKMPHGRFGQLARFALDYPTQGDRLMGVLRRTLPFYEFTLMRRRWMRILGYLRQYAYWRGVRDALGSRVGWAEYASAVVPRPAQTLDISNGLPNPLPSIWADGPSTVALTWGNMTIGSLNVPSDLQEPLRSFLAREIAERFSNQLMILLASDMSGRQFLLTHHIIDQQSNELLLETTSKTHDLVRS